VVGQSLPGQAGSGPGNGLRRSDSAAAADVRLSGDAEGRLAFVAITTSRRLPRDSRAASTATSVDAWDRQTVVANIGHASLHNIGSQQQQ